jgi:ribosomal protein L37AE/L43A
MRTYKCDVCADTGAIILTDGKVILCRHCQSDDTPYGPENRRIRELEAEVERLREALRALLEHVEKETCLHEEIYRGGAIWEICRDCGAKWADDEGGKPEFKWPQAVEQARAALPKEGRPMKLQRLEKAILGSGPRHLNVTYLESGSIRVRVFADFVWNYHVAVVRRDGRHYWVNEEIKFGNAADVADYLQRASYVVVQRMVYGEDVALPETLEEVR